MEIEGENLHLYTFKATAIPPSLALSSGSDQLPGGGGGAAPFCAVLCDEGKGREGDRVRHLLLLSRVGGGIHIAQAVQRDGEREPEGRKGISDGGRKGGLAGCGVHNRGRWMEREEGY